MRKRSINPDSGVLVRQWRDELGFSQSTLSAISGVAQSNICDLELGRGGTGVENLSSLADALSLSTKQRVELIEAAGFRLTPKGE